MIAVIAGTGNLPRQACNSLLKANKPFFIISLFPDKNGNTLKEEFGQKAKVYTPEFYKLNKVLKLLKEKQAKKVLFIGKVDKRNLLKKLKFDWLAIKLLAKLTCKSDKSIMESLLFELEKEGIEVLSQKEILKSLFVEPGILTGKMTPQIQEDINYGLQVAENISFCDIGQTIAIKDKMIIAVEAIEGTDECIKRAITLGKENLVICKTAHKNQNKKYDLPTLGTNSLKDIRPGQIKAIAWQSRQTFIADKESFINKAKELGITLIST